MADQRRSGQVKFSAILEAMQKILPTLTTEFLAEIPGAYSMNANDSLSMEEFDLLFDPKANVKSVPKVSAKVGQPKPEQTEEYS